RRNYSYRTEKAYLNWIKRYVYFHDLRHPNDLAEQHVNRFLSYLANECNVAASTQNQALCAIVFLYKNVIHKPLGDSNFDRAKKLKHLTSVMNKKEVYTVLSQLSGQTKLICSLLCGAGL